MLKARLIRMQVFLVETKAPASDAAAQVAEAPAVTPPRRWPKRQLVTPLHRWPKL